MWIRSQDKETLMDSNGFTLYEGIEQIKLQCRRIVNDNLNTAIMGKNSGTWYYLGTYHTKERALEVLNDIQKEIENIFPASKRQYSVVFEMPEFEENEII